MRASPRSIAGLVRFLFVALAAAAGGAAAADPLYAITLLGGTGSTAADINIHGDVVGNFRSGDDTRGFVYAGAGFTDLGTLGGANSWAHAINDAGQVVGGANVADGNIHAFVAGAGTMSDLGSLGGRYSEAFDIDDRGVIVGTALPAVSESLYNREAFRYENGVMQGLGTLPGGAGSFAYAINAGGLVGGGAFAGPVTFPDYPYHAALFSGGTVQDLGAPDVDNSAVYGLNDLGQAVGGIPTSTLLHASHAFLYANGTLTDLGLLDPLVDDSIAWDINNLGQVVGRAGARLDNGDLGYHGFLYTAEGGMVDLNTLVDPASGLEIVDAAAINGLGQIAATACGGPDGGCHAVRLDLVPAVPEPGTWAMLALGLISFGTRRASRATGWRDGGRRAA